VESREPAISRVGGNTRSTRSEFIGNTGGSVLEAVLKYGIELTESLSAVGAGCSPIRSGPTWLESPPCGRPEPQKVPNGAGYR